MGSFAIGLDDAPEAGRRCTPMVNTPSSSSDTVKVTSIQGPGALHPTNAVVMSGEVTRDTLRASLQQDLEATAQGLPPMSGMADPMVAELVSRIPSDSSARVHLAGDKKY